MYFTDTPTLNSIEAIMQKVPHHNRRGGGKIRSSYRYTAKDCDCRLCLCYRQRKGCTAAICPMLDIRCDCGAASFYEAVKTTLSEVKNIPFQRRFNQIYKDGDFMIYQSDRHRRRFETEKPKLCKPNNRMLAVLYLLTSDDQLWQKTKWQFYSGKSGVQNVHLGGLSFDSYALWKAIREIQSGEKQISLCELSDSEVISDRVFRLIVQAMTVVRFGAAVLNRTEESK